MDAATASGGSSATDVNVNDNVNDNANDNANTAVDKIREKDGVSPGGGLFDSDTDVRDAEHAIDTGAGRKRLTLTFQDVTVRVQASGAVLGETLFSRIDPRVLLASIGGAKPPQRDILHEVSGQVLPGEMLLVLGRPGAGCTSLLRVLANDRASFESGSGTVRGAIHYGSMDHVAARRFRQQITLNTEDDIHFPTLSVDQTLTFALKNKTPRTRPMDGQKDSPTDSQTFVAAARSRVLGSLGIAHTAHTKVGNEFIRGVSGGERKRVSLAEVLAAQSPVQLWDQPTRGLDSKTALEFVEMLRHAADTDRTTVVATLYQAGNAIYDAFDKVLVLAEGCVLYYGPARAARAYFEGLGFVCPPGANIADFLTSVTVATERQIAPSHAGAVPSTPQEFVAAFRQSAVCQQMRAREVDPATRVDEVADLQAAVAGEKTERRVWTVGPRSVYTAGLLDQIWHCTVRQFQIMLGDRLSLGVKIFSATVQALVCGSLFYNMPHTSLSTFLRPGVLFFPVLYFLLEGMSETTASFTGRPILMRHKRFGFYRPTAFCIANALTDIPVVLVQVSLFSLIIYFMAALQTDAAKFFTFWAVTVACTLCFLQLFRAIGALCTRFGLASQMMGLFSTVFFVYGGYLIPYNRMHPWFRWLFYLNPGAYAFEALVANEFDGLSLACVAPNYVPYGPGYDDMGITATRGCTVPGSDAATGLIDGVTYIREHFNYSPGHVWRGFGVVVAFWVFFIAVTALAFEFRSSSGGSSVLLFKRHFRSAAKVPDMEDVPVSEQEKEGATGAALTPPAESPSASAPRQSTFCWHGLDYYVKHQGAQLQLLDKIFGFVQPGHLVALMGSSGAGKTTLLDVLAQRKDAGRITGSILIDGRPQGISFQRLTGYCEQMDVHEDTATVREALAFSALLRQPQSTPRREKLAYVDHILDLLELRPFADALIGVPGAGLSIEQRKRVTLGVELVAKPTLLFLDEPTSGLDGQSAYNIIRFLRRLVDGGQAVLCTIHQPSAVLFEAFDSLLLLAKGGKMAYFGPTGDRSHLVLDYFARNGAPCPPDTNPADHIVEVIQGKAGGRTIADWVDLWDASPERDAAYQKMLTLASAGADNGPPAGDDLEYASPLPFQFRMVLHRLMVQLWRSPDYVWNKINLHIFAALFGGFTFWKMGNTAFDLQLRLFAIFNFVFVAPGCVNQMQPFFLHNRDLFETREKKSKTYHWLAFVGAQIVSEIPYLIICATVYFACWYFTVGFPVKASISGHMYLQMIFYEFLYTSIGQAIAAYAPNDYFAAISNPLLIGAGLITFCGVVVPYAQMQPFWRYWLYYLDPFNYLVGGLLGTVIYDVPVRCADQEYTVFDPPANQTCGEYMGPFLQYSFGYVADPDATAACQYCAYSTGGDYAKTFNLNEKYYAWRDTGITALFCISSYLMVVVMMKLRSKKTKSARSE
ncbi:ABC multidrug transporter [Sporothrix schenckii 1099-18]|uniref:ABC transporter domain-containing protein n=2 Tax=Sporothrix schenckii TaxID=29908 RepID=U7PMX0_SPOS1|nr:ABC multidrug transporter [Sporothrix schenckii 1099-18]ERS96089.1 hypothetical protein HMPREF1624_07625 [Sporothrix schenckii ATCC 58251]KJR81638.1 ABC multidrug transporter [Sporothrix schenckii 1099-18]